MLCIFFPFRNVNAWQVTAGSLPLYMTIVVSLFEDNQDHQVVIDPSLVAHLGTCACKQSEILKNSMFCPYKKPYSTQG